MLNIFPDYTKSLNKCTHMHTYTQGRTHAHTHTQAETPTHTQMHTFTHKDTSTHRRTHTHKSICIHIKLFHNIMNIFHGDLRCLLRFPHSSLRSLTLHHSHSVQFQSVLLKKIARNNIKKRKKESQPSGLKGIKKKEVFHSRWHRPQWGLSVNLINPETSLIPGREWKVAACRGRTITVE